MTDEETVPEAGVVGYCNICGYDILETEDDYDLILDDAGQIDVLICGRCCAAWGVEP